MIITKNIVFEKGKHYDFSYFDIIVNRDRDVYLKNKKHLLLSYHRSRDK